MHFAKALSAVIIVVVCIAVRCNLAEKAVSSTAASDKATEIKLILDTGSVIFQSASLSQLKQLIAELPHCFKKKGATIQTRIGPLLTTLSKIFQRNKRAVENVEQSQSKHVHAVKRCSGSEVDLLNKYFGKFLSKLAVDQLAVIREMAERTATSNTIAKQAYLSTLLPTISACAQS